MDGRTVVAAGLFVLTASTACQPWGPMIVVGGFAGAATEVSGSASEDPEDRPSLRVILRDGRYEFTEAPRPLERQLRRRMSRDPQVRAELDKLVLRTATDGRTGWQMFVVANVLSDDVAALDETWDGFLRGMSGYGRVDVEEGRILGAETAWMDAQGQSALSLRYADDLFITILAPASTPRGHFDDLARSLLRTR